MKGIQSYPATAAYLTAVVMAMLVLSGIVSLLAGLLIVTAVVFVLMLTMRGDRRVDPRGRTSEIRNRDNPQEGRRQ